METQQQTPNNGTWAAVSVERHANKTWKRSGSFNFAAKDAVAPLVSQEVAKAIMSLPMAFIAIEESYVPVAVQGFTPGTNKLVGKDGRWLADYIPAQYRTYPFRLARNSEGTEVLAVNESAAQVAEGTDGEPFFDVEGKPAKVVNEILSMLGQLERDRRNTIRACQVLAKHSLFELWKLQVKDGDSLVEVNGLFRINEARLYELEPSALVEVRDCSGLMLAFAQLFSMQQVQKLLKLSTPAAGVSPPTGPRIVDENGIISFENF